jgi:hypothetical protein
MAEEIKTGFEYKLADGSVVKAENVEEAFKNVAKMKEDTSAALREERAKREEMEARINTMQAEINQRPRPVERDENGFNKDHYFRLVGEDPISAQNYLDAARFGIGDPNQVPGYFQGTFQKVSNLEQSTLAATFVNSHPDFPGGNDNAQQLTKEVMRLQQAGHPVNMDTMDLAWRNCVENETIKPIEPPQEQEEPNPSLSGGGAGTLDAETTRVEADVMSGKMSMADFEKYLRSKGALS